MINMIVATSNNRVIGINNTLPWYLKEDLKYFKEQTSGHAIIMGRKTFESIGRPLPNRTNIVITRDETFNVEGVIVIHSIEEAHALAKEYDEIFVIGGGEIYEKFLPYTEKLLVTRVDIEIQGDTFFPEYETTFKLSNQSEQYTDEQSGLKYQFTTWERLNSKSK